MGETKTIRLTRGYEAIVDAEDYAYLSQFKWSAGRVDKRIYAQRGVCENGHRRLIRMHREILGLQPGDSLQGDHINRNPLDNRRSNLRLATPADNIHNSINRPSMTGFIGVHPKGASYRGKANLAGRQYYTRCYPSPVLAAAARDVLAEHLYGEFAVKNFRFIPASAIRPGA